MERKQPKRFTFERDNNKCIVCRKTPTEAHHLIERKLWDEKDNYGYLLDNLVSVCNDCHKLAENNTLPPQYLRELAGIKNRILPKDFDYNLNYNKWGEVLEQPKYANFKYPTTWYLNFSPNIDKEDKRNVHHCLKYLLNIPLGISIKMDGSNTRIDGNKKITARNGACADHKSFNLMKQWFETEMKWKMNKYPNLVIFGEWLYAKHSIEYKNELILDSYFQCFSIFNRDTNLWLPWEETEIICDDLEIKTVPIIGTYKFNTEWELISKLSKIGEEVIKKGHEGIVIRSSYSYHYSQHKDFVLKYVRKNHVQTDKHWMMQKITRNDVNT